MTKNQTRANKKKLLLFIPAYEASKHIESVIKRIPDSLYEDFHVGILVLDDASTDDTATVATEYLQSATTLIDQWSVYKNPSNQGYGGNQKLGYRYAIDNLFDVVVMVHGDGQYPPEQVGDLAKAALESGGAAFGSRMSRPRVAIAGGMPRYKYFGNKALTRIQNVLLGTELTEFHSGFRAYSTKLLSRIPFEVNSDGFHFDTEILIQSVLLDVKIGEIDIDTHYGDEECRVPGIRYAWNVIAQTFRSKLHNFGLLYGRKFDVDRGENVYEPKLNFFSPSTLVFEGVEPNSSVLDLGSSSGHLASKLKEIGCTVTGIDITEPDEKSCFDNFIVGDLNEGIPSLEGDFDYVLMMDVVEHLSSPESFFDNLSDFCKEHKVKTVFISTGNVAFVVPRMMLLIGQFNYGPRGILDMTHTRLFTLRSFRRICVQSGFNIRRDTGIPAPIPLALGDSRLSRMLMWFNILLIKLMKRLFSYQFVLELSPPINRSVLMSHSNSYSTR